MTGATEDWTDINLLLGSVRISLWMAERHKREQKHSSMQFWVNGQVHAPAVLLLGKESPEHVKQKLGGPQSRTGDNKLMHGTYRGADKSLAIPGRKQATTTKL